MALENNRLNFPKMVDRHIKVSIQKPMGDTQDNLAFFDPLIMSGRELDVMKNEAYVPPKPTNVETSINSIVATVHRNLQKEKRRPVTSPARKEKPEEKATSEQQDFKPMNIIDSGNNNNNKNDNNANNNSNANNNTRNNNVNGNTKKNKANKKISFQAKSPQKPNETNVNVSKNKISVNLQKIYQQPGRSKSIPQIKAHTARKIQQRQHNVPDNPNTYETQKRLRSVLHQKRVLEEILEEHEKIQRDRRNISMEIQVMKQYLADIRYKLDSSLKKLGVKQLIIEKNPRLIKRLIPVISSTTSTNAKNNNKGISINTNTVCKGSTTECKGAPQK